MSNLADPRTNNGNGVFASQGRCGVPDYECFVLDDERHAVTSGTSMSSPLVAGAIALLLQRRPELTQGQSRALLQAGARQPTGPVFAAQQVGPGVLDLPGTLAALVAEDSPLNREPSSQSRIVLGSSFIHPDPSQPVAGLLELRDSDDRIADGFDERRLTLEVTGGTLSVPLERRAAGLWAFELTAPEGSGGQTLALRLKLDGVTLAVQSLPIGVDRWAAEGEPLPRGGCSVQRRQPSGTALLSLAALCALCALRRATRVS
jgi:hypothetical protein